MRAKIDISGIDKATLVAELFNNSKPLGLGFFAAKTNTKMTAEAAQRYLDKGQTYFDYLEGRVMKIDVSENEMDPWGYDRDNGQGAANKVVEAIKKSQSLEFKPAKPTNLLEQAAFEGRAEDAIKLADAQISIIAYDTSNKEPDFGPLRSGYRF